MSDELQNDHAERIHDYLAGAPVPLDHDDVARLLGERDALRAEVERLTARLACYEAGTGGPND